MRCPQASPVKNFDELFERQIELSIVLPCYNERHRLPPYLDKILTYCDARFSDRYEVLISDDGGTDGMTAALQPRYASRPEVRWLRYEQNRGRGAAYKQGVSASRGDLVLLADADGATPIEEIEELFHRRQSLQEALPGATIGAICGLRTRETAHRTWFRNVAGHVFRRLVRLIIGLPIHDTQCGFKLFDGATARRIFPQCRENGWLCDIEALMRIHRTGVPLGEAPVRWTEIPGTRVRFFQDALQMSQGLLRCRRSVCGERPQT